MSGDLLMRIACGRECEGRRFVVVGSFDGAPAKQQLREGCGP